MIPAWDISGLLPPIRPGVAGHDSDRSPYESNIIDVVTRFGTTPRRREILRGLLSYREDLHSLGVTEGFQWLNGSFSQEVEVTEDRDPGDIDVVTFLVVPDGQTEVSLMTAAPHLFRSRLAKPRYNVDAYVLPFMNQPIGAEHVERVTYWYSMWSHTKVSNVWKGFVSIPLSFDIDALALISLNSMDDEEDVDNESE